MGPCCTAQAAFPWSPHCVLFNQKKSEYLLDGKNGICAIRKLRITFYSPFTIFVPAGILQFWKSPKTKKKKRKLMSIIKTMKHTLFSFINFMLFYICILTSIFFFIFFSALSSLIYTSISYSIRKRKILK